MRTTDDERAATMTLDMHALTVYRLAMKHPDMRPALLSLAAALQRGANRLATGGPDPHAAPRPRPPRHAGH